MLQQNWLAVVNEKAGGKKAAHMWPEIDRKLRDEGINIETQRTQKAGDAITMAREGLQKGYTGIIAVGGDGTLNEAVNGFWHEGRLINPEAVLTYVNLGSGGDFARMVEKAAPEKGGLSRQIDKDDQTRQTNMGDQRKQTDDAAPASFPAPSSSSAATTAERLINGSLQTVDIGLVCFEGDLHKRRYFINAANVGVGAETVRRVNQKETKPGGGGLSYMLSALAALVTFKPQRLRVVVDGTCVIDEELYAAMVCNGRFIGAGMMIAPEAQITDGLFDIVAIHKMPLPKLLTQFPKIYSGSHLNIKGVSFWQGARVEISDSCGDASLGGDVSSEQAPAEEAKSLVEIDGEILGCCPASYRLLPRGMTMWLPVPRRDT
ncbi:MAG: diacylglycerol kinase family lipid kinase [Peptococcaceae bacterium]|nr:diacylglycerol kinase family lipid kinase [Peptococcaceae bacterium]